jgi:hypothetical protein
MARFRDFSFPEFSWRRVQFIVGGLPKSSGKAMFVAEFNPPFNQAERTGIAAPGRRYIVVQRE